MGYEQGLDVENETEDSNDPLQWMEDGVITVERPMYVAGMLA